MNAHIEETQQEYAEEYYFHAIFNEISDDIVSDEYFDRNYQMLKNWSDELYNIHQVTNSMPPKLARRVIETSLSNIFKFGLR